MRTNNTSDTQAVKQIHVNFSKTDAAEILNLMWFTGDLNEFDARSAIPFSVAVANFCDNLTSRPVFWDVGDDTGAHPNDIARRKHALFFAVLAWLARNDVITLDEVTSEIRLNPWRVDYDEFEETQQAIENSNQGFTPCNLTRAQCLLVESAEEVQLTARPYVPFVGSYAQDSANDGEFYEDQAAS